ARRMRTLMRYAPRKYDPALIEALAINGALTPNLNGDAKAKVIARVAEWLGVTDAHIIEPSFLVSAEARKLDTLAKEQGPAYATPSTLRALKKGAQVEAEPEVGAGDGEEAVEEATADSKCKPVPITRPSELLDAVLAAGRK